MARSGPPGVFAVLLLALPFPGAEVLAQVYLEGLTGLSASSDVTLHSGGNDRSSVCDEYINPRALQLADCITPDRGVGGGWQARYGKEIGWLGGVELGYRLSAAYRVALSASRENIEFDQTVSSTNATGEDLEKLSNELALGRESLYGSVATDLFLWVYRDFAFAQRWSAELGLGAGVSTRALRIGWNWTRSSNPQDIETGRNQPNFDEIRANLAGTRSVGEATIRDDLYGGGLSVGVAKRLHERLAIGLKAQWRFFSEFASDPYAGTLLRSHAPNLRLDGSEPVTAWSSTKNTNALVTTLVVRYWF